MKSNDDTIAAIATPSGQGGIGIVRISGPKALNIADRVFQCKSGVMPSLAKSFTVHYGHIIKNYVTPECLNRGSSLDVSGFPIEAFGNDNCVVIDEALLTIMRGPKSYTAQDVIEINCHGGLSMVRAVLSLILDKGARLAEPGEFTKRAFLNGRIDLAQAEAVLDIIHAKTANFARVSQNQLDGQLSKELNRMRAELISVYITIEALINFPEDDIDAQGRAQILQRIDNEARRVNDLLKSADTGRILKEGMRIVLCGKPNAGKSSLLNVLLKQDRAIVTDIAGTTRDVLEESTQIKGVPFQLVDTAGILEPRDLIEEEAVKRSHLFIESADLVLLVLDVSRPLESADRLLIEKLAGRNVLFVLNKSDLPQQLTDADLPKVPTIKISALQRTAVDELQSAILEAVLKDKDIDHHSILISNVRHQTALKSAAFCLTEALRLMAEQTTWEFIAQDLKDAVNHLDSITGRNIDQDLLDRIFSEFCIGK